MLKKHANQGPRIFPKPSSTPLSCLWGQSHKSFGWSCPWFGTLGWSISSLHLGALGRDPGWNAWGSGKLERDPDERRKMEKEARWKTQCLVLWARSTSAKGMSPSLPHLFPSHLNLLSTCCDQMLWWVPGIEAGLEINTKSWRQYSSSEGEGRWRKQQRCG